MAWGSKTSATQLTNITSTRQYFSTLISLNPGEQAVVQVEYNPVGTPTDDLEVVVETTLDDSSEVWDLEPYMSFILPNDQDPNRRSFIVAGPYKFRVGVNATGGVDTHTSADLSYRKDGVSA